MDEQIRERLEKYLDTLESGVSKAGEFLVEQTPLAVQEFLAWSFWEAIFYCVALSVGLVVAFVIARWTWPIVCKWDDSEPQWCAQTGIILLVVVAVAATAIGVPMHLHTAVKIKVAPRVVLIEKLAELRK